MYFKNDNSEIEILVGGYTDIPEYYEESVGKNALSCQVSYYGRELGDGILWDDLFQTDDIVKLHTVALQLANGEVDSFVYKDQWDMVIIIAKQEAANYQIELRVIKRSRGNYLSDTFVFTRQDLNEFITELENYKNLYPVRT